jgi:hypothetical protein
LFIEAWERFLRSLETEGGGTIVLITIIAFFSLIAVFMELTGHRLQETGRSLLAAGIGSALGILWKKTH